MPNELLDYQSIISELQGGTISSMTNYYRNIMSQQNTSQNTMNTETSPYTFSDWAKLKGYNVTESQNQLAINKVDIDPERLAKLKGGYGSPQVYQNIIDSYNAQIKKQQDLTKITQVSGEEGETLYTSPYKQQINDLFTQLQEYTPYKTSQELENYVFNLMQGQTQPFNYDPSQDKALKIAQKEAGRQVREAAGGRGTLYSSGTLGQVTRAKGALIPQYEQRAYQRYADQKNRELQMATTLMKWDEMQANRHTDQLNLIKEKFNYVMDMDQQNFQRFQLMLDQKNWEKQYQLQQEQLNLERQIQDVERAYERVDALGYVDRETSIILGLPTGTKAPWAKELEIQQKAEMERLKKEQAYQLELQKKQAKIDKDLIKYKNALDLANQKKLAAEEHKRQKELLKYQQSLANKSVKTTSSYTAPKTTTSKKTTTSAKKTTTKKTTKSIPYQIPYSVRKYM